MQNAVVYLITETKRMLMIRNKAKVSASGKVHAAEWDFPGGMVDDKERSFAAAKREFHEEAGFPLPPPCYRQGPYNVRIDYGGTPHTRIFFVYVKEHDLLEYAKDVANIDLLMYSGGYDLTKNKMWQSRSNNRSWVECDRVALIKIDYIMNYMQPGGAMPMRDNSYQAFMTAADDNRVNPSGPRTKALLKI